LLKAKRTRGSAKCGEILEELALARMNKRRSGDFFKEIEAISLQDLLTEGALGWCGCLLAK